MNPGEIDRTTEHEKAPFLDRCQTPSGVARELVELHRLILEGGFLPPGSDVQIRFSLMTGMAAGMIWRLEDKLRAAGGVP